MLTNNRILLIALGAMILGGSVVALVMHRSGANGTSPQAVSSDVATNEAANNTQPDPALALKSDDKTIVPDSANAPVESNSGVRNGHSSAEQVVYVPRRTRYSRLRYSRAPARAYYSYGQPRSRTFWQKHRDKLTLAMGTGGGAILGGLIGGGKGAAIGALAGGGGSALYTYKIRKRHRNYNY